MTRQLYTFFPEYPISGAIFSKMKDAPWQEVPGAGLDMDIAYLAMWSGNKPVTYFVTAMDKDGVFDQQKLADILWTLYGRSWKRLWDALNSEYNPLNNYDVEENVERDETIDKTTDRDITENGTVNYSDSGSADTTSKSDTTSSETENTTVNYGKQVKTDSETDNFVYGFNSASEVPTDIAKMISTEVNSGNDTTNRKLDGEVHTTGSSGTTTTDESTTTSKDTTQDDIEENTKDNEKIARTRVGNIGQNTYQELLSQEFELWKWNFFHQVFMDCDKYLVLSIFPCY